MIEIENEKNSPRKKNRVLLSQTTPFGIKIYFWGTTYAPRAYGRRGDALFRFIFSRFRRFLPHWTFSFPKRELRGAPYARRTADGKARYPIFQKKYINTNDAHVLAMSFLRKRDIFLCPKAKPNSTRVSRLRDSASHAPRMKKRRAPKIRIGRIRDKNRPKVD